MKRAPVLFGTPNTVLNFFSDQKGSKVPDYVLVQRKQYGCLYFLFDCFMTIFTGGLWLIWVFVREMRGRR
jgi:hypothetical protein